MAMNAARIGSPASSRSLNDLRLPLDWEVIFGESLHNRIDTGLCVVEPYRDLVRVLIRVILEHTRDFLQGITYPARCDRSLASRDHQLDDPFGSK